MALDNPILWYLDLGIDGFRVVGKVWQAEPVGETPKGAVRPSSPWCAVGMATEWADTDLGKTYQKRNDAMRAVGEWWNKYKLAAGVVTIPPAVEKPGADGAAPRPRIVEGGAA